jgi:predicted RNA-binding protein associated with RNAse of E/G family
MDQYPMYGLRNIVSGEWRNKPYLTDYRVEWLSNMMVERVCWDAASPPQQIAGLVIAGPGYIWARFWLLEQAVLVEKYFDQQGQPIGYYLPICLPVQRRNNQLQAFPLYLALWSTPDGRLTVLDEDRFDEAAATGDLTPVETEHAEHQIREFTTALSRSTFPPALVRNFALQ